MVLQSMEPHPSIHPLTQPQDSALSPMRASVDMLFHFSKLVGGAAAMVGLLTWSIEGVIATTIAMSIILGLVPLLLMSVLGGQLLAHSIKEAVIPSKQKERTAGLLSLASSSSGNLSDPSSRAQRRFRST